VPRIALVVAPVLASFAVSALGYLAILVVLRLTAVPVDLFGIPAVLAGYLLLLAFAAGFALLLAPLQVFVRDIAPALPQLTMLGVFLSPVFYSRDVLPEPYRSALDFNPYTAFAELFRWAVFHLPPPGPRACVVAASSVVVMLGLGYAVFRRLQAHVEDFL
jgi:ABC-type polysaccharide/polyol phosphate export permease